MELLGVLIVIAIILAIAGISVSQNVKRANRDSVSNELSLFATAIADAYYDLGSPELGPADPGARAEFERFLRLLESDYLSVSFDYGSIQATGSGFEVDISSPLDTYESKYHCWFITGDSTIQYAMIASGGDNGIIDSDGYASQDFGDDILLVVKPKF